MLYSRKKKKGVSYVHSSHNAGVKRIETLDLQAPSGNVLLIHYDRYVHVYFK